MKILYLGDVMAEAGQQVLKDNLDTLIKETAADLVVAQAENLTAGKGVSVKDMDMLLDLGVDFLTGGNWTGYLPEINERLIDKDSPVIGPTNFDGVEGPGYKMLKKDDKKILFVSLLGQVVGKPLPHTDNPLTAIDDILAEVTALQTPDAIVVNFHGDFSSEKKVIGHYLDGRVTAVIGDHWHIQTNDAAVLPGGTAHITDVGMCGSLNSSLGVSLDSIIPRWRDGTQTYNKQDSNKPWQINAVLIDSENGLAKSVDAVHRVYT